MIRKHNQAINPDHFHPLHSTSGKPPSQHNLSPTNTSPSQKTLPTPTSKRHASPTPPQTPKNQPHSRYPTLVEPTHTLCSHSHPPAHPHCCTTEACYPSESPTLHRHRTLHRARLARGVPLRRFRAWLAISGTVMISISHFSCPPSHTSPSPPAGAAAVPVAEFSGVV